MRDTECERVCERVRDCLREWVIERLRVYVSVRVSERLRVYERVMGRGREGKRMRRQEGGKLD